ncbi:hypothetical protein PHLGIDRAFT_28291 [Phlebiopsis gigantea 11061_1 CR5-6]|uniref:Pterin-binding domain-containing protein n=1 Tax=Phlebiopsis gigantea (strain 11061_1 CR5-6) TaxID=745531 RepID=A0A0C3NZG5_PHLG1|nr:hypothetical protein PHLGIDRAFT_28291 [Phlebiopsis gigantea 11061_1 CR5-6]
MSSKNSPGVHVATIAVGANIGDRFANIELALRLLEGPQFIEGVDSPYVHVVDTSFMYETEPMYETDQPMFINCCCLIHTNIEPVMLLRFLKHLESTVGRVVSYRNGPRAIDLDILTYDDLTVDTRGVDNRKTLDNLEGQLVVPHPRLYEREFVLRPLNDIIPDYTHPTLKRSVNGLFTSLIATAPPTATYWKFPVAGSPLPTPRKTYIMGTLNMTPDSFSDGSVNNTLSAALEYAATSIAAGADILDVGGYSTRPGAAFVSTEEETTRVVPVVRALRDVAETRDVLLSVDTFRPEVAAAAVRAGANCVNDVHALSGPTFPPDATSAAHSAAMRAVLRDLAVPVVLMHSRGEASANKDYTAYDYAADARGRGAVLEAVRVELGRKVDAAVRGRGGLRRWLVIIDPGIGFSKTLEGNLEVLRGSSSTVDPIATVGKERAPNPLAGYPTLIGASRKSFLGTILAQPDASNTYKGRETKPVERKFATSAAVACAVQQGATIVRVHDVIEMGDVVRVTSLLWG